MSTIFESTEGNDVASSIDIRIATAADCEEIQTLFNHKEIIAGLGGFTILDNLKKHITRGKASMWVARDKTTGKVVGAMESGGRPQSHILKYGSVGVHPEYRRQGISTCMYWAMTCQGILEGRRLFEDTIVGDNPHQFIALPKMGLEQVARLKHRTASGKDLCLFQMDLCEQTPFEMLWDKSERYGHHIEVLESYFTVDVWPKNMEIIGKHPENLLNVDQAMIAKRARIHHCAQITVLKDMVDPTTERRKLFTQRTLTEE